MLETIRMWCAAALAAPLTALAADASGLTLQQLMVACSIDAAALKLDGESRRGFMAVCLRERTVSDSAAERARSEAPAPQASRQATACAVDSARFRDVGPAFVDRQSNLAWRYCAVPQSIEPGTKKCVGSISAIDKLSVATFTLGRLNERIGGMFRMPTIDEVIQLAEARCGDKAFGRSPLADYGGAPIWTTSTAADGKVYQYDPEDGGRKAVDPDNAPGVILLVIQPRR
jgi:hypothetical protein